MDDQRPVPRPHRCNARLEDFIQVRAGILLLDLSIDETVCLFTLLFKYIPRHCLHWSFEIRFSRPGGISDGVWLQNLGMVIVILCI